MSEAQRLKMTGGHFIWIWADTSSTAEFFQPNSVPSGDDKEMKANYESRQYYQQAGNKRLQNNTRYKSPNANRFHQIVGLQKSADDAGFPSILPERDYLKLHDTSDGQVSIKDKRDAQKPDGNDYSGSIESGKPGGNLNIKNINSREFNANDFDPYSRPRQGESDNVEDFDDSSDVASEYYDFDKINPYQPSSEAPSRSSEKSKANNHKNSENASRNNRNNGNNNKPLNPQDHLPGVPFSKPFDDDMDLENYSEASNDLKAKRDFPASFNISSHVFFHHFKDFPVGLLALRHIKMNVDRVFVRSAIRLFASTWSRVDSDEELRVASGGVVGARKDTWQDSWSGNDYDYDEVNNNYKAARRQKGKTNVNVNSRHNNARGSRKYKRDAPSDAQTVTSIPNLVNSSNKTSNSNSKLINDLTNKTHSQHVSDLNSHPSDDVNKSNNDNIKNNNVTSDSNKTKLASHNEVVHELSVDGKIEVQKRQNSWWSSAARSRVPETMTARGTPQYKGGCFGVPTRADMKRSELFARWDANWINLRRVANRNLFSNVCTDIWGKLWCWRLRDGRFPVGLWRNL